MKKILYLLSITFLMLQSCTSGSNDNSSNSSSDILIKEFYNSNGEYSKFIYIGNKIKKIDNTDGSYAIFSYTNDLITQMSEYSNTGTLLTIKNYYYLNDNLVQTKTFENGILSYQEDLIHNSNGMITITESSYVSGNQNFSAPYKMYFSNGNCIKIEDSGHTALYSYDTKNSPFKGITGFSKLIRLGDLIITNNNPVTIINPIYSNSTNTINYSYQFNSQNYPILITSSQSGIPNSTTSFTYY
jgi:hypothetical protein